MFATPENRRASLDKAIPLQTLNCAEYNATSYWRTADVVPSMQDPRLSKLCTCWYDEHTFVAEMFCKSAAGSCAALPAEQEKVWARDKGFNCGG